MRHHHRVPTPAKQRRTKTKEHCAKRAAEMYDEALFRQPPKGGDCPICFLLLPTLGSGKTFMACCGKTICGGCIHEYFLQSNGSPTCPFCRVDAPSDEEFIKMLQKRIDANDANSIIHLAREYLNGNKNLSIKKDTNKAAKLFHHAAEIGSEEAFRCK
jgi:TPR repeat protein